MRVIFLGTPEFALNILGGIAKSNHQIIGVVTQIDKINARGNKVVFSKVKEYAIANNIPIFQYKNISIEGEKDLRALDADIMVTAAFGQILRQNILDICKYGIINVHASLLPKYRGSSPVQWALINGEKTIGVSIMQTELGIDTGDVILQKEVSLSGDENSAQALDILAEVGASAIVEALDLIEKGQAKFVKQNNDEATHCRMLIKEDGLIDFSNKASEIVNFVRGMTPWPSAYTDSNNGRIKILKAEECDFFGGSRFGEVVAYDNKNGIIVKCGVGYIRILVIQGENSKAMDAKAYLLGKKLPIGSVLGG